MAIVETKDIQQDNPIRVERETSQSENENANNSLVSTEKIKLALSEWLCIDPKIIRTQENKDKYYDPENSSVAGPELQEVFTLMKRLNESALAKESIAAANDGSGGFRETLTRTAKDIARQFEGKEFLYVDLGPEPSKTVFLIKELQKYGARIRRYTGVDINPASKMVMQEALSGVVDVDYKMSLFDEFSVDDIRDEDGLPALVTTLGFQEGNEDPISLPSLYHQMLRPGDVLLSEMQLYTESDGAFQKQLIKSFYNNPMMRRFSRIAFERKYGDTPSDTGFALLPVGQYADEDLWAAVLYEVFHTTMEMPNVFVTNYCMKYSKHQFRELRQSSEIQEILVENFTGDSSVVFQLSQRVC